MRTLLRRFTSTRTRQKLAFSIVAARQPTARWRPLPNLLVIGAQRCGTSSLFKYLGAHPQGKASIRKEVRFFTEFYDKGVDWYRSHFPIALGNGPSSSICFEVTPDYLLDPRAPKRVIDLLPDVRVIVLLRDPVDRAFSQYRHNRRQGTEWLPFREALAREAERIVPALLKLEACPEIPAPKDFLRYSYLERGRYANQLQRWKNFVDDDRMLVLRSEDLFEDPRATFQEILSFLGLHAWHPDTYQNFSFDGARPVPPPIPLDCSDWLTEALAEDAARLPEVLGSKASLFDYRSRWGK